MPDGFSDSQAGSRDLEADIESVVLGSCLVDESNVILLKSEPLEIFGSLQNRNIVKTMFEMWDNQQDISFLSVADAMKKAGRSIDMKTLVDMMNNVITTVNFEYHVQMLKQRFRRRKVTGVITQSRIRLEEGGDPNEIAADLMAELSKVIEPDRQNLRRFNEIAETLIARIEVGDIPEPIPTGLSKLDTPMGGGLARSDLVVVAGRPSMGKCLSGDQRLMDLATGELVPIERWAENKSVTSLGTNLKLIPAISGRWIANGTKPCFAVRTRTGRAITATSNHPLLTMGGWKTISELSIGSRVAVPRCLPNPGKVDIGLGRSRLLAYMVAEGSCTRSTPYFTNADQLIVTDFGMTLAREFPGCRLQYIARYGYDISFARRGEKKPNPFKLWLRSLNAYDSLSKDKKTPHIVFTLSPDCLREYIRVFFSCDGSLCYTNQGRPRIELALASEGLVRDMQHLLLRFGIISYVRYLPKKCNGKEFPAWRLDITNHRDVERYSEEIGWVGGKAWRGVPEAKIDINNCDNVPRETWNLIDAARERKDMSLSEMEKRRGVCLQHSNPHRGTRDIGRQRLLDYAEVLDDQRLRDLATSDVFWDEIVSIDLVGERQTYDIEIPELSCFVAEDIVVHNSAFSSQIAVSVAKSGKKVLVFPVEMNAESVAIRILSSASGLEPAVLRNTRFQCDWSKVRNAISPISKSDLWFDDDPALTSNKVILVAKDLSARLGGLDLVVVDYLQILSDVPNENRNNYLGNVTKMFKTLARQLNCPVILVSQLNRQVENRRGNRPTMADLRDTGELENHADGILLLHRPHYYDENADEHETHLIIAKQRNGVTDTVPLHWDSNHLRFSCVDSRY